MFVRFFNGHNRIAWMVLLACLSVTLLVWHSLRAQRTDHARAQFDLHAREIVGLIEQRLRQHEQILLGGAGLFDASDQVTRRDWHAYVERLRLTENYPGIQGVGFSQVIAPDALAAHIAEVRAEGFPDYVVKPPGRRELYTSIVYIEPFSGRNLAAFGYDMFSQETRRKAMRWAVENGSTAISGKVKLVQETYGKPQAGFLMYVPVYRKGLPTATAADRWRALAGFVYSPYRVDDLMQGILGERRAVLDFSIHDGPTASDDTRMHDSRELHPLPPAFQPGFSAARQITAFGQGWTITLFSRPGFEAQFGSHREWIILLLGVGISLSLFGLTASLSSRRERALELAGTMTAQIRENENRLRQMLESAPIAARIARFGGHEVIFSNRRYAELLNLDEAQVGGVDPANYYANPGDYADIVDRVGRGERIFDRLVELAIPGVGPKWALSSYLPIQHDGQAAVLGWFYDITDRKRAEVALQEQFTHTQAILDNTVDGIITINAQGVVASLNKAAVSMFGYTAEEVLGHNVNMLMPEPYHSAHDGYLRNYLETGVARIIGTGREVSGRRKDGSIFPLDLAVSEITQHGQPLFIGMVRDITERKRMERMKSEFVSTVSHELRTPLTSISGALGLLAGGAMGALPDAARPLLEIAVKNSQRLTLLINDLLDMEKIAAGKLHFEMRVQPLMPLIEQALEANASYAQQYQVAFFLAGRADDVMVCVDGQRLIQVLSNFLSNAAKFSPPGSQVEIAVERQDGYVRISVSDHGPGIPEAFRGQVFERFSQADASDTRQKGGTGLGLAITKGLVERMQGRVGFDSVEGVGSRFHFDLPVVDATSPNSGEASPISGAPGILVVEDDPDIAKLLSIMLQRAGYHADVAATGDEAMRLLEQRSYAAMTLDLTLPDINGLEIIRQVRGHPLRADLPIIVVSARMEEGRLALRGDPGAVEWLPKPVDEKRLLAGIEKALPAQSRGKPRVLHVEDDPDLHEVIRAMAGERFDFELATTLNRARALAGRERFDVVLLDLELPDGSGWELLPQLREQAVPPRVIILSGTELRREDAARVEQALLKSQVSPQALLDALDARIGAQHGRGGNR